VRAREPLAAINSFSPFIFAIVIPLAYPFMVPLGLHWPINAIMLLNIQTLGYDFIQGPMGAWNFACFGATAGVLVLAWREKDKQMRQTATGALAAGLLGGISEPSLYGIHLRYKRIYPRMLVGCLTGGLIIGIGSLVLGLPHGITTQAFVFTSLLTIPAFDPIGLYLIAVAGAFVVAMVLVIISGYKNPSRPVRPSRRPRQARHPSPRCGARHHPGCRRRRELAGVAGEARGRPPRSPSDRRGGRADPVAHRWTAPSSPSTRCPTPSSRAA
jgi:PTS system beta-glucosides-specific IIC component